jgi:hypothetical protein
MNQIVNGFFPGILTPDTTVCGCVDIYENVWPDSQQTLELLNNELSDPMTDIYWQKAETIGLGAYQNKRSNKMMPVTHFAQIYNNKLMQHLHNQFNMILLASSLDYANRYKITENLIHEGYSLLKYSVNEGYIDHYDGGTSIGRCVSAICYLNDDFDGGELEFVNFKIKIRPEPGMLILFPSNFAYRHTALPIKNGIKYAMVTWLRDRDV